MKFSRSCRIHQVERPHRSTSMPTTTRGAIYMRKRLIILIALTALAASAQTKINPTSQINWPLITGAGTPTSLSIACTSANYGQPFQDTAVTPNTYYTCGTDGWAIRGGSGAATVGPQYAVPSYSTSPTGTTLGPSNVAVDSTGNNLAIPGTATVGPPIYGYKVTIGPQSAIPANIIYDDTTAATFLASLGGLPLSGGAMTGPLVLAGTGISTLPVCPNGYGGALTISGCVNGGGSTSVAGINGWVTVPPVGSSVFPNLQNLGSGGWISCGYVCSGGWSGGSYTATYNVTVPSLTGNAMSMQVSGQSGGAGSNAQFYTTLSPTTLAGGVPTGLTDIARSLSVYIPSTSAVPQGIEGPNVVLYTGTEQLYPSVQCAKNAGSSTPTIATWNAWSGTAWIPENISCAAFIANTNTWQTIQVHYSFSVSANTFTYQDLMVNSVPIWQHLGLSYSGIAFSSAAALKVQEQVDGNSTSGSTTVLFDNDQTSAWAGPTYIGTVTAGNVVATAAYCCSNVSAINAAAATSGANQSSGYFGWYGSEWNGSATFTDYWTSQLVLGTGSNPTSTLTFLHSGTTGGASFSVPAIGTILYNVGSLPSAASLPLGTQVTVKDATTFTPGTCTGGGSDYMIAITNGSTWSCH
jgi:hypothetical protein